MSIDFNCPECDHNLHVPDEYAGRSARCKKCNTAMRIPESIDAALSVLYEEATPPEEKQDWRGDHDSVSLRQTNDAEIEVACPKCKELFGVEFQGLGPDDNLRVTCDHCGFEKKLSSFRKEYERRNRVEHQQREAAAAEHSKAEEKAKHLFALQQLSSTARASRSVFDRASSNVSEITFEGKYTPNVQLLPGESVLDEFEASLWDLGLFGWIFGYKRRMVLTTHRLFHFRKKIIDNLLEVVWLKRAKAVVVGQEVKGLQFAVGVIMLLATLVLNPLARELQSFSDSRLLMNMLFLIELGVSLLVIVYSRQKVMMLSTGDDKVGMKLTRIRTDESKRFVDKVFAILSKNEP